MYFKATRARSLPLVEIDELSPSEGHRMVVRAEEIEEASEVRVGVSFSVSRLRELSWQSGGFTSVAAAETAVLSWLPQVSISYSVSRLAPL